MAACRFKGKQFSHFPAINKEKEKTFLFIKINCRIPEAKMVTIFYSGLVCLRSGFPLNVGIPGEYDPMMLENQ